MSIRQLFIASSLAVSCWLPAAAQSVPLVTSNLSLSQAMQAAQNNLNVSLARRALDVARGDVTAADRAPIAVLSSKTALAKATCFVTSGLKKPSASIGRMSAQTSGSCAHRQHKV